MIRQDLLKFRKRLKITGKTEKSKKGMVTILSSVGNGLWNKGFGVNGKSQTIFYGKRALRNNN